MSDLGPILTLWRELEAAGAEYVLATIVGVEGSSYRRPGARMLIAADGRRAGTVSGGCLEAEVAKRGFWLTESGPVVEGFSTFEDDGERPYGSGCGGVVSILLEREQTAAALLTELNAAFDLRMPLAITTVLEGSGIARRAYAGMPQGMSESQENSGGDTFSALSSVAQSALQNCASIERRITVDDEAVRAWGEFRPARPGLWIFSAGDDAKPLVSLARELGWFVAVADGRSHLATRDRFPSADSISVLDVPALPEQQFARLDLRTTDAAVVMTHSFEQDSRILASLLSLESPLAYVGVLGPQRRTREMLVEAARLLNLPANEERVERWLTMIHAPTGLDLGADTPASIALSIVSEIQQTLNKGSALPLSVVRATRMEGAHS